MELYTMDREFNRVSMIDVFESAIWTERYYGDHDFQLTLPISKEIVDALKPGTFVGRDIPEPTSTPITEPMITETLNIENGELKVTGISLSKWLNNRFIRTTYDPATSVWNVTGIKPGQLMSDIVQNWCIASVYLTNTWLIHSSWPDDGAGHVYEINPNSMGMLDSRMFKIPYLEIEETDTGGSNISVQVPFGPVYDALKALGEAYEVGMKITLKFAYDSGLGINRAYLGFHSYRGKDRTSDQTVNPLIKFSPDLDSLTNIKELKSNQGEVDVLWTYPSSINPYVATWYGIPVAFQNNGSWSTVGEGWDLRVAMDTNSELRPEDLTDPPIPYEELPHSGTPWPATPATPATTMVNLLLPGQKVYLKDHNFVQIVDGEVVPTNEFQYGRDYALGDVVDIVGYSGAIQKARITEYIRAQDSSGERAYPTITIIE